MDDKLKALKALSSSFFAKDHLRARQILRGEPDLYDRRILFAYLNNPFFQPEPDELTAFQSMGLSPAMLNLIAARDAASRSVSPKYAVFCMPKSGSSFVQSALSHALGLPFVSLTSFATPASSSNFGMNSREQELDELAIIKSAINSPDGFVAQHHTRYCLYLALKLKLYGISPIVTVRNILDCIVSFDDMMKTWRSGVSETPYPWAVDSQFALPLDYDRLDSAARYRVLAPSFGAWLVNFYLSWVRGQGQGFITPVIVRYNEHVMDGEKLVGLLSDRLSMTDEQAARLRAYVQKPDKQRSRLNVGRIGRGEELLPDDVKRFLTDYVDAFRSELTDDDRAILLN